MSRASRHKEETDALRFKSEDGRTVCDVYNGQLDLSIGDVGELSAEDALRLGRWLIDTFGETETKDA